MQIYRAIAVNAPNKKDKVEFEYHAGEEIIDVEDFNNKLDDILVDTEDSTVAYLKTITVEELMNSVKMI
ncbi:hypothetical protein [Levilactobacillus suantsaiihabitans]|uniref:Uncharacterized protein n=1 Tax=Levilactobacillus suantsaiihabitans TaxID=2487722 RepID=A0A4Z0JCQ1_9LACO|nr:hypothetical protein [Levilactobacillus suantsaiihabitans]TGD18987.1 hypothetical protein EGT51_06200 [Levilactobacillus suantsaiihabitans]